MCVGELRVRFAAAPRGGAASRIIVRITDGHTAPFFFLRAWEARVCGGPRPARATRAFPAMLIWRAPRASFRIDCNAVEQVFVGVFSTRFFSRRDERRGGAGALTQKDLVLSIKIIHSDTEFCFRFDFLSCLVY